MTSNRTVSVVIPTYYRNEQLRTAIRSALDQESEQIEILVVDDSGEEHARPVATAFDAVTYVPLAENRGAQAARKAGVERATGQYIQFLDDDDRLLPTKVSRQVALLSEAEAVGVAYCGLEWVGGPTVRPRPDVRGDVLADALRFDTAPCMMGTMLIDRSVLDQIDLMKHDHAADDIGLKIDLARRTEFDYVDEILVRRGNSEDSLGASSAAVDGRFEVLETFADLYAEFPPDVRREALGETYLVQGQLAIRDSIWSLAAVRSFALATYHAPGLPLPYLGSLTSSAFGRPGYALARWLYSRVVLGTERRGKWM